MTPIQLPKPKLVIAGPGAGKTHNMVDAVTTKLQGLSPARYMAVITYTNAATENIRRRLSKQIAIPPNLFVGTTHAFLNRFIVVPLSSLHNATIGGEKLFLQCETDAIYRAYEKKKGKQTPEQAAIIKANIKKKLNAKGYISFDQTLAISQQCVKNKLFLRILSNRLQYLFVDEFQDTNNAIFDIIEGLRKEKKTEMYCVGDPEQFITSFDSAIRNFANIPILKVSRNSIIDLHLNTDNHRCSESIVKFLNNFNGTAFNSKVFQQHSKTGTVGQTVRFIMATTDATKIIPVFKNLCSKYDIETKGQCILAKRKEEIKRVSSALKNNVRNISKNTNAVPMKAIMDTFLAAVQLSVSQFCSEYKIDILTLRKYCVRIFKAINTGQITDENTFGKFLTETFGVQLKPGIPINISDIKVQVQSNSEDTITVSTIHSFKGLEADAVLAIARTRDELSLWLESDRIVRESKRTTEKTDYPRIGYVAFSRARHFLCIACLEPIDPLLRDRLRQLNVEFENGE